MLTVIDGALAFLVECALVVGVGRGSYVALGSGMGGWLAALLAVVLVLAIWAVWAAPASHRRLAMPGLILLKTALFAVGTLAWTAGPGWAAPLFGAAAALSLLLSVVAAA